MIVKKIDLDGFGKKISGKVRDCYIVDNKRILITTDRISAFDKILGFIPQKGAVLNLLSAFWFENTKDIIKNHVISVPDPNVTIASNATLIPIEMVVRGYITGVTDTSIWGSYEKGERVIYGIEFPERLRKNQKLATAVITPTTKAESGHDQRLTKEDIIQKQIVSKEIYEQMEEAALKLFARGQKIAKEKGLILVDTKYEFGLHNGELMLIDEIHTPDNSRFWIEKTYATRFAKGEEPENFDKEFLRLWFATQGYKGDGTPPEMPEEFIEKVSKRYTDVYTMLTGKSLPLITGDAETRIKQNIENNMPSKKLKEKCAIFGAYNASDAAKLTYFGLYALQHRGQESSGITVSDGETLKTHKGMGLVPQVYTEKVLEELPGNIAIGHNRYSTSGGSFFEYTQPFTGKENMVALAHNGNIPDTTTLVAFLEDKGIDTKDRSDSGLMHLTIRYFMKQGDTLEDAIKKSFPLFDGAFSLLVMTKDKIAAVRDRFGIRPFSIATLGDGYIFASETCAFDTINAEFLRDVTPGEMVIADATGLHSHILTSPTPKLDIFEFVYFSRPDSMLYGKRVYEVRKNLGKILAKEVKIDADVVIPVPDSSIPAAIGYAQASNIPFEFGLMKNRYIGRTFIMPQQALRDTSVKMKLNPIKELIEGKRVIVIDDSIVRGTTSKKLITMLRNAGAKEVHLLSSCPPVRYPDFYGIDTPVQKDLIAASMKEAEIEKFIGADSLHFLSYKGMIEATGLPEDDFCTSCFTGEYPIDLGAKSKTIKHIAT